MAEQGVTLEQMKALLKEELTPLKEAISSMESKLEAHDTSLEDLSRRFSVLEDAPAQSGIDEKVKLAVDSQMKTVNDLIPDQIEQTLKDKIAVNYEDKMTEMIAANETNSNYLIEQLITFATSTKEGKSTHADSHSSGNKTFVDYDPARRPNIYFGERMYRKVHEWWEALRPPTMHLKIPLILLSTLVVNLRNY